MRSPLQHEPRLGGEGMSRPGKEGEPSDRIARPRSAQPAPQQTHHDHHQRNHPEEQPKHHPDEVRLEDREQAVVHRRHLAACAGSA